MSKEIKIRYRIIVHMVVQKVYIKENDIHNINDVYKMRFSKVKDYAILEGFLVVSYYDDNDNLQTKLISNKHIIDVDVESIEN